MIRQAWNLYILQIVGDIVCSMFYKDIVFTAKFHIVKGVAVNAVPLLSYSLQLHSMHELTLGTSCEVMSVGTEGNTQILFRDPMIY